VTLSRLGGVEAVPLDAWRSVHRRTANRSPFLSPAFLLPWHRAFAQDRATRVAMLDGADGVVGFLFLCARGAGEPGWELMGGNDVADVLDALIVPGEEPRFWDAFLSDPASPVADGPLVLQSLPADSPTLDILSLRCPAHGLSLAVEQTDLSPFVRLPGTFDGYLEGLDKKARHELRRKMRRAAEALPGLSLRICREPAEVAAAMPSFVDLHRRSHPDKAAFMDPAMAAFFEEIAAAFAAEGILRLAFLSDHSGDVAAAFQLAAGDRLMLYNSGFDPARREANPGLVLIARCIEAAIDERFAVYDFLRGTERYKYDLGGTDRAVLRATIARP
jgi:CelD/BcsL family acetyltransferase involved in cellulose biosynthesis